MWMHLPGGAQGRGLPKDCRWWQGWKHPFPSSIYGGRGELGTACWQGRAQNLVQSFWPTPHSPGGFCFHRDTWNEATITGAGRLHECPQDQLPEHNSCRHQITKISIFMGPNKEASTQDFCPSPSPDVLTMLEGWIFSTLRNRKYRNYGSMAFVTKGKELKNCNCPILQVLPVC